MWWMLETLFRFLHNSFIDFIFFALVDIVVKTILRDAANDAEKRAIWLYEAGVLLGICCIVYWAHHTPYLLLLLTLLTGVLTQLCVRIDFRQWWTSVRTRWEEYQQHEESMRQVQAHLARQQATASSLPQSSVPGTSGFNPSLNPSHNPLYPHLMPVQGYPPNVTLLSGRELPGAAAASSLGPVFRGSHGGLIWSGLSQSNNASGGYFTQQSVTSSTGTSSMGFPHRGTISSQPIIQSSVPPKNTEAISATKWYGGELKRKPLRQIDNRAVNPSVLPSSGASAIKNKFMNALGFGGFVKKPPGLRNNGQNQCFMNAVLQCLARSPYLVPCLAVDAAKELECTVSESFFLSSLSELLDLLTAEPETLDSNVVDSTSFRKATSSLNTNLVAPVGHQQSQQDAAEFLMWILDMVHSILNKNRQALSCDSENGEDRFSSPRLAQLRYLYGDLTPARAREARDACMRDIELANGLENDSYAEPIQKLSDLDWLLHKHQNDSIIDSLFTGQLVEALLYTSNNGMSVSLQTFNVLPVPLAAPRPVSGLVLLEDCFTSFCNIENLVSSSAGAASFSLDTENKKGDAAAGISSTSRANVRTRSSAKLAAVATGPPLQSPFTHMSVVSPIAGHTGFVNDSGFSDKLFKTSTPIRDNDNRMEGAVSHAVKRRCLLSQLPECLTIQLMRFQYNVQQGRSTKICAPVSIRLKGLNLRELMCGTVTQREDLASPAGQSTSQMYDLYGLCLHLGANSTHHGHYISYALAADSCWYRYDDENVRQVNIEYELTTGEVRQNAYILFYKQAAN